MPRPVRDSDTLVVATAQTRPPAAVPHPPLRCAGRAGDRQRLTAAPCAPLSLGSCDIKVMLFTTQVKHRSLTPPDDHPVKLEVTFCVRGVMTPPCGAPLVRSTSVPSGHCTGARSHRA